MRESTIPLLKRIYLNSFYYYKRNPVFFLPFALFALIELFTLFILYLAPRQPLAPLLGPPIKTFWGEVFLHYPANFILLPKILSYSRMFLSVLIGGIIVGTAVAIVGKICYNRKINLAQAFQSALGRYLQLFFVLLILNGLFFFLRKIFAKGLVDYFMSGHTSLIFMGKKAWLGPLFLGFNFMLSVLLQSMFIYAIPSIIISRNKFFQALSESFSMFRRFFVETMVLVGLPLLLYVPILIINSNTAFLIHKVFPEIVLVILTLSIIVTTLAVDPLVTMSTALLYLAKRKGH